MPFHIVSLMHLKREQPGYHLIREHGTDDYVFIHFISPVRIFLNGKWTETEPDACILYSPGQYQEYRADTQILINNFVHFQFSGPNDRRRYSIPVNTLFYTSIGNAVTEAVEFLVWNYITKPDGYSDILDRTMDDLFCRLEETAALDPFSPAKRTEQAKKRLESLRSEIYRDPKGWTVEKMAECAWYSRTRFTVVYGRMFGNSPKKDLMESAILKAKRLLASTSFLVSDIAFECGFDSVEYFIRLFKRRTGVTPGAYRKEKNAE